MGASKGASQWGKGAPILPKLPACCLRWAGPVPPGSVPSGSFPAPLPPHLSKGSMQKGAIWSFVDTFSLVQYLPGVNAGPGSPESAVPPAPAASSPTANPWSRRLWGQAHWVGEPCGVRASEESFSHTHPHTRTENW